MRQPPIGFVFGVTVGANAAPDPSPKWCGFGFHECPHSRFAVPVIPVDSIGAEDQAGQEEEGS